MAIATTAEAAIAKVKAIHEQVSGTLPDGSRISRDRPVAARLGPCRGRDQLPRRMAPLCRAAHEPRRPGSLFRRERRDRAAARRRPRSANARRGRAADRAIFAPSCAPTSGRARFASWCCDAPAPSLGRSAGADAADECGGRPHARFRAGRCTASSRPLLPPMVRGATFGVARTIALGVRRRASYRRAH